MISTRLNRKTANPSLEKKTTSGPVKNCCGSPRRMPLRS